VFDAEFLEFGKRVVIGAYDFVRGLENKARHWDED
jgi:hypothetical protein